MKKALIVVLICALNCPLLSFAQNEIKGRSSNYTFNIKSRTIKDVTPPALTIFSPISAKGETYKTLDKQATVSGFVKDENGIFDLTVNGQDAALTSEGKFLSVVPLVVGLNTIFVSATDGKNNTVTKTIDVERSGRSYDGNISATGAPGMPGAGVGGIAAPGLMTAQTRYFALIIGINTYDDPGLIDLDEPISDATKVYNVLTTNYTFERDNVTFLENPTFAQMIDAVDHLSEEITPNDNLLIFYAGHGYWDDDKGLGYWLPADAQKKSTAKWFRNSTLSDYIGSIESKHTLLIADACFSGSIFKTRKAFNDANMAINKLYELPSRKAMTSGTLKEVPDKSVFVHYLVKRLEQNSEKYVSSQELFSSFRIAVLNNSPNVPQYGEIHNAGDEGGDFIFIRR